MRTTQADIKRKVDYLNKYAVWSDFEVTKASGAYHILFHKQGDCGQTEERHTIFTGNIKECGLYLDGMIETIYHARYLDYEKALAR